MILSAATELKAAYDGAVEPMHNFMARVFDKFEDTCPALKDPVFRNGADKDVWDTLDEARQKSRLKNIEQSDGNRQKVLDEWGEAGSYLLQFNNAQRFNAHAAQLARLCPDHREAFTYINRVIWERRVHRGSGQSYRLTPGQADLQRAVELVKETRAQGQAPPELHPNELHALAGRKNGQIMIVNSMGMIDYGSRRELLVAQDEVLEMSSDDENHGHIPSHWNTASPAAGSPFPIMSTQPISRSITDPLSPTPGLGHRRQTSSLSVSETPPSPYREILRHPVVSSSSAATGLLALFQQAHGQPDVQEPNAPAAAGSSPPPPDSRANIQQDASASRMQEQNAPSAAGPFHPPTDSRANIQQDTSASRMQEENAPAPARPSPPPTKDASASRMQEQDAQSAARSSGQTSSVVAQPSCSCLTNKIWKARVLAQLSTLKIFNESAPEEEERARLFVCTRRQDLLYAAKHTKFYKARLCSKHLKHLARALNLVINGVDAVTLVKRLAKVSMDADDKTKWITDNINSEHRAAWFRHGNRPAKVPVVQNRLHPFKYKAAAVEGRGFFDRAELLKDLGEHLGVTDLNIADKLASTGFVDIPNLFSWWFESTNNSEPSIADLALEEAELFQHHLRTAERVESNPARHEVFPYQYGIFQQLLEQDPVFYLLTYAAQPSRNPATHFIAYPRPAVMTCTSTGDSLFRIPGLLLHNEKEPHFPLLRGFLPLRDENKDSCSHIVSGLGDPAMAKRFATKLATHLRRLTAMEIPGIKMNSDSVAAATNQVEEFTVAAVPVENIGTFRLVRDSVPVAHKGNATARLAYQPVLVPTDHMPADTTENDLRMHRRKQKPISSTADGLYSHKPGIHGWAMATAIRGISELSDAVMLSREFNDKKVEHELSILLGPDRPRAWLYINHWRQTARALVAQKYALLKQSEIDQFGSKSYFSTSPSSGISEEDIGPDSDATVWSTSETDLTEDASDEPASIASDEDSSTSDESEQSKPVEMPESEPAEMPESEPAEMPGSEREVIPQSEPADMSSELSDPADDMSSELSDPPEDVSEPTNPVSGDDGDTTRLQGSQGHSVSSAPIRQIETGRVTRSAAKRSRNDSDQGSRGTNKQARTQ